MRQSDRQRVSPLAGTFVRYTSREARECSPQNKEGYIFTIKKKGNERREDYHLPDSWADFKAYIISSSFDSVWFNWDYHAVI